MEHTPARHRVSGGRRGATVIIVILALAALLGASAIVVDLGYTSTVRQQLQAAVDAGAHAGAAFFDTTDEGLVNARAAAVAVASYNDANGTPVVLDGSTDVVLGNWDFPTSTFTAGGAAEDTNAIWVTTRRDDLPAFFSRVAFGRTALSAAVQAIAVYSPTGAGEVQCFLPIAVPSCVIEDVWTGGTVQYQDLVINPPGVNNIGWAREGFEPNADYLMDMISNCEYDGATQVGDELNLGGGVDNIALMTLAATIEASPTTWNSSVWGDIPSQHEHSAIASSLYGRTLEAPIMVIEDDSYCTSPHQFGGSAEVSGFVWGAVYDVRYVGSAANKNIWVRLDLTTFRNIGTDDGGKNFGVQFVNLALVK